MSGTLLGLFRFVTKGSAESLTFQGFFIELGSSALVFLLCCFIVQWIVRILVDLEKGSRR